MGLDFAGKVAVVTGASGGIGEATCRLLIERGATVIGLDLNPRVMELPGKICGQHQGCLRTGIVDLVNTEQVRNVIEEFVGPEGRIDILINAAGIGGRERAFDLIDEAEWHRVLVVNLTSVFFICQLVAKRMVKRRYGRIVNISSVAGRSVSLVGGAHYTASKAGLIGLTRHLARELAPYNVTANALCPGMTNTSLVQGKGYDLDEVIRKIPLGRIAEPTEQAAVAVFLASDEASYITGACIDVNGGVLMI